MINKRYVSSILFCALAHCVVSIINEILTEDWRTRKTIHEIWMKHNIYNNTISSTCLLISKRKLIFLFNACFAVDAFCSRIEIV